MRRLTPARLRAGASRLRANLRTRGRHVVLAVNPAAYSNPTGLTADFASWVLRGAGRGSRGFPDSWLRREDLPIRQPARIAVVVHVYFRDLLDEILDSLAAMPCAYDLFVTNATGAPLEIRPERVPSARAIVVVDVENRGRDLWPLAQLVNAGLLDPYLLVLKLHTKRSEWRDDHTKLGGSGADWRRTLLSTLLGNVTNVTSILDSFAGSPRLGLVTADGSVLGHEFWGDNEPATAALLRRLELDLRRDDLAFAAGSMYWVRGFVLQGLRSLELSSDDFEDEAGQVNATTAHALERLIGIVTREAGLAIAERSQLTPSPATGWTRFTPDAELRARVRAVPFYLPQFHPIPQNDRWWGKGFTEWTNVVGANPVYQGHYQPRLPTLTGFYDLRLDETVRLQADLAKNAGIAGFMYYHYWFAGQQLLEGPIMARLAGDVDLPFCLMWANENWTRRWDGRDDEVLIGQHYENVPSGRFLSDVVPVLRDPRYLRVDGRAVVAIYRPAQIPDLQATVEAWRQTARSEGVGELLILNVDVAQEFHGIGRGQIAAGLDGSLGFPPHNAHWEWLSHEQVGADPGFEGNILSYGAMVSHAERSLGGGAPDGYFPGVMVAFDNTARRRRDPDIWYGSNPYTFRRWLAAAVAAVAHRQAEERLVFVNAWNEWAEGAALEPNDRFGSSFLLAMRDVIYG